MEGLIMPRVSPKEERVLVALVFVALAVLIISFVGIQKNIRAPFTLSGEKFLSAEERAAQSQQELKSKDTDKDGLTDYDELLVYGTSAYLEDTDSDGYSDGMEVKSGNNPNCPKDKTCGASGEVQENVSAAVPVPFGAPTTVPTEFNAAEIRALLRASGVSDDVLSKVDDATLRQLYEESLNPTATSTNP